MGTRLDTKWVAEVLIKGITTDDFLAMVREVERLESEVHRLENELGKHIKEEAIAASEPAPYHSEYCSVKDGCPNPIDCENIKGCLNPIR